MAPFMVKIFTCSGPSRELALVRSGGPACICTDNFGVVLRSGKRSVSVRGITSGDTSL